MNDIDDTSKGLYILLLFFISLLTFCSIFAWHNALCSVLSLTALCIWLYGWHTYMK